MSKRLEKQLIPKEEAPPAEKRRAQKARARRFKIEALEDKGERLTIPPSFPSDLKDYGDPANLKFPLVPDGKARNARARFKQFAGTYTKASSQKVVHMRIVERLLKIGALPSLNEDDPLDMMLPASLRGKMKAAQAKARLTKMDRTWIEKQFELAEGEELHDAVKKIQDAVSRHRVNSGISAHLMGIFKDHIILRDWENGRFLRMDLKREGETVELSNLIEVRQVFVPIEEAKKDDVKKSEDGTPAFKIIELPSLQVILDTKAGGVTAGSIDVINKFAQTADEVPAPAYIEQVEKKDNFWGGVVEN